MNENLLHSPAVCVRGKCKNEAITINSNGEEEIYFVAKRMCNALSTICTVLIC